MAINVNSHLRHKGILELYINDKEIRAIVVLETSVTGSKLPQESTADYTKTNSSCRQDALVKRGGGGGILIYVHDSIPYYNGITQITTITGEMEFCSTELFPNYSLDQRL